MYRPGDHILSLASGPAASPVSLSDMKNHLRVDHSDEDILIQAYINAAVASLDASGELGRAIITQTWDESLQNPTRDVYLGVLPVSALVGVTYFDADNVQQTADLSDFDLFKSDDWAFVRSDAWPSAYDRPDAITIQYTAGADAPPVNVVHAVKLVVGHWYQNREDASDLNLREIPRAAASLINLSRGGWYGG